MAIYKLFPYKDATLYSFYPTANTGLDQILEVSNGIVIDGSPNVSRALVAFDQNEIDDVIENKISSSIWAAGLRGFIANAEGMSFSTLVYAYPVSSSWNNGTGQFGDNPITTDGVSWKFRISSGSNAWRNTTFSAYVTASYLNSNAGGGNWYTGSSDPNLYIPTSQSFDIRSDKDLNLNVTDTVKAWYSSSNGLGAYTSILNNGFIIKFGNDIEFTSDIDIQPNLKYYSVDTHTIYPPQLELKWRDFVFNTGSSTQTIINTSQLYASVVENPGFFYPESINRFRVECRPLYPPRVFQTSSIYTTNYYLPTASYYAIKDLDTDEYVIDFDSQFTQISADDQTSYFDVYMNGLQPERYYKILIKTIVGGSTIILDNNYYFKIING